MGSTVMRKLLPDGASDTGPLNGAVAEKGDGMWSDSEPTHGSGPT
jgi:hypothetical protein